MGLRLLIVYAKPLRVLHPPHQHSIHLHPIPRGGGIVFIGVALVGLFWSEPTLFWHYKWSMVAIVLVWLVGVWDDIVGVSVRVKFFFILFATLLVMADGLMLHTLGVLFGTPLYLGLLSLPVTLFIVAGFTNAMNLVDGIDGLAGSLALLMLLLFALLGLWFELWFVWSMSLMLLVTLSAFLLFNLPPASLFMGDSGSLSLGFILSLLSLEVVAYIPAVEILYMGAVPIVDTLLVMFHRRAKGASLFGADCCHIHHLLLAYFNGSASKSVGVLLLLALFFLLVGGLLYLYGVDDLYAFLLFVGVVWLLYRLSEWGFKQLGLCQVSPRASSQTNHVESVDE